MADELSELVDSPTERMDVEYKSWLDLSDHKARADLARHIAAIANFGGGSIVFGIDDNGASCGHAPSGFDLDHDSVASITRKYLEPVPHCDVRWTLSAAGVDHPVIQVPPHGPTPICAKANGPDHKGKIEGIVSGVYYLRKPGPESSPIVAAADWRDLIRRCALHDRTAILAAISAALNGASGQQTESRTDNQLERWADAADGEYRSLIEGRDFVVPLRECRIQLSYRVQTDQPETLPTRGFADTIRQVSAEVDQYVVSGWSLFYVFGSELYAPRWASDNEFLDQEFLQANLVDPTRSLGFDLWRVSPGGLATVIREYWEDTPDFRQPPRTTLNPRILTRMLGELIRHAEAFGGRFATPTHVDFRCHWRGLKGRRLYTPNTIPFNTRAAVVDEIITSVRSPITDLGTRLPELVEALGGRVARALDWEGLTAERVALEMPSWRERG